MTVTIIAELGSNPAPAWDFAPWCATAANCGADGVKVQLFTAGHFPADEQAAKRVLEFPRGRLISYARIAHAYKLQAGASVFDADAVTLAALHCDFLKLAAREQGNYELRDKCLMSGKPVYRSISDFDTYLSLPCTTLFAMQEYPAPMVLSVMQLWMWCRYCRQQNNRRWGWSSHTTGILDCVLAASLGASVIEKHLALSPHDIEASHGLLPAQFAKMVRAIRSVQKEK